MVVLGHRLPPPLGRICNCRTWEAGDWFCLQKGRLYIDPDPALVSERIAGSSANRKNPVWCVTPCLLLCWGDLKCVRSSEWFAFVDTNPRGVLHSDRGDIFLHPTFCWYRQWLFYCLFKSIHGHFAAPWWMLSLQMMLLVALCSWYEDWVPPLSMFPGCLPHCSLLPTLNLRHLIIRCGRESRMGRPFASKRLSTHHLRSSRAWVSKGISKLLTTWGRVLLFFKWWIPRWWRGAWRTAVLQEVNFPIMWEGWLKEVTWPLTKWRHSLILNNSNFLVWEEKPHGRGVHDDSQEFDLYRNKYGFLHVDKKS